MLSILYKQQQLMSTYLGHLVTHQTGGYLEFSDPFGIYILHFSIVYIYALLLSDDPFLQEQELNTPVNSTTLTVSWSEVQCLNESETVIHYLVQYQSMCVQNVTTSGLVQDFWGLTPNSFSTGSSWS